MSCPETSPSMIKMIHDQLYIMLFRCLQCQCQLIHLSDCESEGSICWQSFRSWSHWQCGWSRWYFIKHTNHSSDWCTSNPAISDFAKWRKEGSHFASISINKQDGQWSGGQEILFSSCTETLILIHRQYTGEFVPQFTSDCSELVHYNTCGEVVPQPPASHVHWV